MKSTTEYCDALGIKPSSTPEQFKQAYRDLVNVWHPDRFAHDPRLQKIAEEKLKEINEAYEHLKSYFSNPRRESSSSERTRSKTKHEQPKANEPPPKPPPNANSQPPPKNSPNTAPNASIQDILGWLRKPWLVGVFAFMVVGALIPVSNKPVKSQKAIEQVEDPLPKPRPETSPQKPIPKTKSGEIVEKPLPAPATRSKQASPIMKKGDRELNQSRAELINNLKETRAEAERLLRLHEAERQRALEDYIRRRDSYYQGLVARNEVLQAEQTLLEAMARVDNDKRWIAEADLALMEYVKGNSK